MTWLLVDETPIKEINVHSDATGDDDSEPNLFLSLSLFALTSESITESHVSSSLLRNQTCWRTWAKPGSAYVSGTLMEFSDLRVIYPSCHNTTRTSQCWNAADRPCCWNELTSKVSINHAAMHPALPPPLLLCTSSSLGSDPVPLCSPCPFSAYVFWVFASDHTTRIIS